MNKLAALIVNYWKLDTEQNGASKSDVKKITDAIAVDVSSDEVLDPEILMDQISDLFPEGIADITPEDANIASYVIDPALLKTLTEFLKKTNNAEKINDIITLFDIDPELVKLVAKTLDGFTQGIVITHVAKIDDRPKTAGEGGKVATPETKEDIKAIFLYSEKHDFWYCNTYDDGEIYLQKMQSATVFDIVKKEVYNWCNAQKKLSSEI